MSGAQGAQPKEAKTATVYESVESGENKTKMDLRSREDQGSIQVDRIEEKVENPTGDGGPIFGSTPKDDSDKDLGVTGTA
ncbi:Seed maturation protein PM41 [Corchorus olitorius]|uniref:Seed maturation protein PM41 n=1 Tax=Corchorus olitorius TaxID=93759 RepID=A0A1R3I0G7_9ROSI|nr:Seed maturation protein PM41 [Corchorus olitorius]